MGQGGDVVIVNGTELPLQRTNIHSYQMDWSNWPEIIAPFSAVSVYVEFDEGITKTKSDDGGDVTYSVPDGHLHFNVHASFRNIKVTTTVNGQTYTDDLGWNHDGKMGFVVAGTNPNYYINNSVSGESWMTRLLPLFGDRCLRDITLPGSHDAGMSEIHSSTAFSDATNTKTQSLNIHDQLIRGSRYFDIRPIIGGGQYWTGHYSYISQISSDQGSRGQSIDSVIQNINDFTASHNELVILKLSHDSNTDLGNGNYRSFTKDEYQGLLQLLSSRLNHLFYTGADVTLIPLNEFINGRPAVIVFVDTSDDFLGRGTATDYTIRGFYPFRGSIGQHLINRGAMKTAPFDASIPSDPPAVSVYDSYSETEDLNKMMNDQIQKMENFNFTGPDSKDSLFLLSWTLTLSDAHSVLRNKSIEEIATEANQRVYDQILPNVVSGHRPNILYLDFYSYNSFTALVVAINLKLLKA
eukprot:gene204-214_t